MKKFNVLILTDHTNHSKENSVYAFAKALRNHQFTNQLDIATRGISENDNFFKHFVTQNILATKVKQDFRFTDTGLLLKRELRKKSLRDYDLIWLRLPPPLDKKFLDFLTNEFPDCFIINSPTAIYKTGSKEFLMNFRNFCPPMKVCKSIEDIIELKNQFPIVLKPFREYGGKGLIRIDGKRAWKENQQMTFNEFISTLNGDCIEYLGVKFLKNVKKGDKRIIVVNGKVMGASLRLPAEDSWLCNVSMGGTSNIAEIVGEELQIIEAVNPQLSKMGIVMYGLDTLVDDEGKRVLSEINTTSIGGLPQIAQIKNQPLVDEAIDLIWKYYLKNQKNVE